MEIEFRIIEDENLPIIFIDGEGLRPVITINAHSKNRVWLSIHRNTIPGITQSLQAKLSEICDSYLKQRYWMEGEE
jgi:hypothetical protein